MYLVTIAPWVELVANVHVLVLRALLWWRSVCLMLPMFVPQSVGIGRRDDKARDCDAVNIRIFAVYFEGMRLWPEFAIKGWR